MSTPRESTSERPKLTDDEVIERALRALYGNWNTMSEAHRTAARDFARELLAKLKEATHGR